MAKLDKDGIKDLAKGQWKDILPAIAGIDSQLLDGRHHPCPKCSVSETDDRFSMMREDEGALLCRKCFDTRNGDGFAAIQWLTGCSFYQAVDLVAKHLNVELKSVGYEAYPDRGITWWDENTSAGAWPRYCRYRDGITEESLIANGARAGSYYNQTPIIALPLYGEGGEQQYVIFHQTNQKVPIFQKGKPPSYVKTKCLAPQRTYYLVGKHGVDRLESEGVERIIKVEGLTDLLALWSIIPEDQRETNLVITNAYGAGECNWQANRIGRTEAQKFVVHDNDLAGRKGLDRWTNAIAASSKDGCHKVILPGDVAEKDGLDLRDWINEGHTWQEFIELCDQAELVEVKRDATGAISQDEERATAIDKAILEKIQLFVIGEEPDGRIVLWSGYHGKRASIMGDTNRFSYEKLVQIAGEPAKLYVRDPKQAARKKKSDQDSSDEENKKSMGDSVDFEDVQRAIAYVAGFHQLDKERILGSGCWLGQDEFDRPDGSILLVNSKEISRWTGAALERYQAPHLGNASFDLGGAQWYHHDLIAEYCEKAQSHEWCGNVINEAIEFFNQWKWEHVDGDVELVTGLVLATWIQSIWDSRPMVCLVGESNAGKTTFFDSLTGGEYATIGIFGRLAATTGDASAAGIRQELADRAKVLCLDEFDQYAGNKQKEIFGLLRTSTRGTQILRGTGQQKSQMYGLRHLVWIGGTSVKLGTQMEQNRYIRFTVKKKIKVDDEAFNLPPGEEIRDLGWRLLATAVVWAENALEIARAIKGVKVDGIPDQRVIENYGVPVSILTAARGLDRDSARELLLWFISRVNISDEEIVPDHYRLMDTIMSSRIRVGQEMNAVGSILRSEALNQSSGNELQSCGIRLCDDKLVFLRPESLSRYLLGDTQWRDAAIDQILLRYPGAQRARRRIGGTQVRGVIVKLSDIGIDDNEDEETGQTKFV